MARPCAVLLLLALAIPASAQKPAEKPSPQAIEHFEKHVRPVLLDKCVGCHGPKKQRGSLRLDSRKAMLDGGDTGPAIVAGQPDKSLLITAVRQRGDLKMPPKEHDPLSRAEIDALAAWITMGAPYPDGVTKPTVSSVAEARKKHWSFRPVSRPSIPDVQANDWAHNPIDRFVLARLEQKKLSPSSEADRRTLIRRITFDLTGLPPTPEEVDEFVNDASPDAYEKVVERLLSSPSYGERWGRHWLDVARYADTKGYVFLEERRYPYSYTYRDYTVRAFNEDLPYDRFVVEQLAADLLPLGDDRRPLAAMGFLTLGRRFLNNVHDIIDDRIDVMARGLMGLTVACARCHDHKYDPIPTRDYYSLYGVFASSSEPRELPLLEKHDPSKGSSAFEKELQKRQANVDVFLKDSHATLLPRFRAAVGDYLLASQKPDSRDSGLSRQLVQRWREYLTSARGSHHPVLSPYFDFASLPGDQFAAKAPALAERIAANADRKKPINPLVAKAFAGKPPASLADVAKKYQALFSDVDARWQKALKEANEKKQPAPTKLPDADAEAVRQILYGPDSPTNVPVGEIDRYFDRALRNKLTGLRRQVDQWRASSPDSPPRAMSLAENASPTSPRVLVRGIPGNPGVSVPRQFLEILSPDRKPFSKGSGRLELAQAIASKDNPLTARVLVNRVWMHHFGKGIVTTSGDFGFRGEPPTHPELLDWLASEFVSSGWSVKHLHRLIVLSATYRQVSEENDKAAEIDPENALLWRMNRRRLEFEPLRDALLFAADRLDRGMGGKPVEIAAAPFTPRRTLYGFIDRQNLPGVFRTFDLASPDSSTPQRHSTTVPQQALFLMNGPFAIEQAKAFAARADVTGQKSDAARLTRMYRIAYGRDPDAEELDLGLAFVRGAAKSDRLSGWEQYAQVVLLGNEFAFVD